mgnify:CR=1 FL=1
MGSTADFWLEIQMELLRNFNVPTTAYRHPRRYYWGAYIWTPTKVRQQIGKIPQTARRAAYFY